MSTPNGFKLGLAILALLCLTTQMEAKVKLPALITDGMVLQREQPLTIWGTADAGECVDIRFVASQADRHSALPSMVKGGKLKATYRVTAD